jgi:hypothetical protein
MPLLPECLLEDENVAKDKADDHGCTSWQTLTILPVVRNSRKIVDFPLEPVRPNIVRKRISAETRTVRSPNALEASALGISRDGLKTGTPSPPPVDAKYANMDGL